MTNEHTAPLEGTDGYELGTFHFLHAGWWITHIIGFIIVFYAGWYFAGH